MFFSFQPEESELLLWSLCWTLTQAEQNEKLPLTCLQKHFNKRRDHYYSRNLAGTEEAAWDILAADREGERCECMRRVRRKRGWLKNPRERRETACILREGQLRGGERFTDHIYCPLKSPTAAKTLPTFLIDDS